MNKNRTVKRKLDHIKICLSDNVEFQLKTTGFEEIHFIHRAIPKIKMDEIDLSVNFLNHNFKAPIIIGAMTGGHPETLEINKRLAIIAEEFGIGMGVGSQRAALENNDVKNTFSIVRDMAPNSFLLSNIGAPQLRDIKISELNEIIEILDADALAIHLNPLQESIQPEGETSFIEFTKKLSYISKEINRPIMVKETGAGISKEDALELEMNGASAVDISGAGGTSWAAVEAIRGKNELGKVFREWGIPTAISLV
ncbi:MAG: type 2 isopentenyl-diphosphate Delta-isomerase, partial [Candidatus Odinarchaeia archaeon]